MSENIKYTSFKDIPRFTPDGSYAVDYPFVPLVKFIEEEVANEGLQLNPDFQRGHVWTEEQQVAYISPAWGKDRAYHLSQ